MVWLCCIPCKGFFLVGRLYEITFDSNQDTVKRKSIYSSEIYKQKAHLQALRTTGDRKSCWNYCHQDPTRKVPLPVFTWPAVYASWVFFFVHNQCLRLCSPGTIHSQHNMPGFVAPPTPEVLWIPPPFHFPPFYTLSSSTLFWGYL